MDNFLKDIKNIFFNIHKELINKNIIPENLNYNNIYFDIPKNENHGDISTNALLIYNKYSSINIKEIFSIINKELLKSKKVYKTEFANPGFINIFLEKKYLFSYLFITNKLGNKFGDSNIGKQKKINIEFVSANPTGPLHIAHSRGAVFGDVLSNLLKKVGYKITKEYYVNDSGRQINILGESLFIRYQQELNIKGKKILDGYYPGDYLIDLAKEIIKKDGNKWINVSHEKRKNYFEKYGVKKILKIIKSDLKIIGIKFDKFTLESEIISKEFIKFVFNKLKTKNLLYEGQLNKPKSDFNSEWEPRNQLLFRSTMFGDDSDRPFKKSNNDWTYFANDSAYHYNKISRGYYKLFNIWGSDHIGYIKRMQSMVSVLSDEKIKLNIKVCQLVHLKKDNKPIKMSKRSGNYISIKDVVDEVGSDALRFFMLFRKNDAQMDFDLKKVLEKNKDNPIFYVQYAYARSSSVLRIANLSLKKINYQKFINIKNFEKYISDFEWKIINKILSWPNIVENSAITEEPHKIVYYLENLSALFHTFWNQGKDNKSLRLIDKNNMEKTAINLYWIQCMQIVYRSAFRILGIKPLNKM